MIPANSPRPRQGSATGRVILWIVIVLLVALGSYASYLAFRANPYVSDVARNGVSKWRFIEECKADLDARVRQQLGAQLPAGTQLQFPPPVQRAQSVAEAPGGGWQWQSLVLISPPSGGGVPAQFVCTHDKATHKTSIVALQPAQQ